MPDGTATIVGAGIDSLWVTEVPADVGIFLMMRISGAAYEFEESHTIAVKLVDPESGEHAILTAALNATTELPPLLHAGLDPGVLLPAAIAWQAEHFGLHTIEIFVDDKRERSVPILVRDASEIQGTPTV